MLVMRCGPSMVVAGARMRRPAPLGLGRSPNTLLGGDAEAGRRLCVCAARKQEVFVSQAESPKHTFMEKASNPYFWTGFSVAVVVTIIVQKLFSKSSAPPIGVMHHFISDADLQAMTDAPIFTLEGLRTRCKVVKVYDGDTCTVILPVKGEMLKFNCRLKGINAPELKPPKGMLDRDVEISKAKSSQAGLADMIMDKVVTIRFYRPEKYGRQLVELWNETADAKFTKETSVNQEMVRKGLARPFMEDY